ncbi:DMT family transporter [Salinicoccus siamensis]|uniref:DMT family transporter n=1 Tax=Salinicoccus siamensis TaxID=381830 RepID=A0ABV5Z531_9STAP
MGAVLALVGVVLSTFDGTAIVFGWGEGVIVLTMLTFAVFMILIQWMSKYINAIQITLLSNLSGLILLLPFLPAADYGRLWSADWTMWFLLIASGIIVHGITNMAWNREMPKVGAANAALLMNLEPFVAMSGSTLILGTDILITEVIGAILIISGVTLSIRRVRRNTNFYMNDLETNN